MLLRGSPRLDIGADEFFNYLLYVASISCFRCAHTRTWHPLFELTGSFALKLREDPGAVIIGTTGDDTVAVQFFGILSLIAAFSHTPGMLIAVRALLGVAGALGLQ